MTAAVDPTAVRRAQDRLAAIGAEPIDDASDRAWFDAHPGRRHRVRRATFAERRGIRRTLGVDPPPHMVIRVADAPAAGLWRLPLRLPAGVRATALGEAECVSVWEEAVRLWRTWTGESVA